QPQPGFLALFGVKLRSGKIAAPDHCSQRPAVIGGRKGIVRVVETELEAVDKIDMGARLEPSKQRMGRLRLDLVPSHVRDLKFSIARLDRNPRARDRAKTVDGLELATAVRHKLHTDANAEKRAGASDHGLVQG